MWFVQENFGFQSARKLAQFDGGKRVRAARTILLLIWARIYFNAVSKALAAHDPKTWVCNQEGYWEVGI
jgi:hypothetical protein